MEQSEIQKEITKLGSLIVCQLKLSDSGDTLGRWMAHYIAEKMTQAQNAIGKEKEAAEKECSQVILEVWKHRWEMQKKHSPFINFERIFKLVQQIDPEVQKSYFYNDYDEELRAEDDPWLIGAYETDKAARFCLEYMLSKAARNSATTETTNWLDAAEKIKFEPDVKVIKKLLSKNSYSFDTVSGTFDDLNVDYQTENIKSRIAELDNFEKLIKKIKSELKLDLKKALKHTPKPKY